MCIIKIKNPPLDAFPANSVAGFINVKVIIFGWGLRNEPNEYLREVGYILTLFNIMIIIRQVLEKIFDCRQRHHNQYLQSLN